MRERENSIRVLFPLCVHVYRWARARERERDWEGGLVSFLGELEGPPVPSQYTRI